MINNYFVFKFNVSDVIAHDKSSVVWEVRQTPGIDEEGHIEESSARLFGLAVQDLAVTVGTTLSFCEL